MALPKMDSDPTAIDHVSNAQQVTTATTIAEARAHLHASGETAAVVYQTGRPIGVVTAAALDRAVSTGHADAPICAALDYVAVPVTPGADAQDTERTFTRAARNWLQRRPHTSAPGAATR